MSDEAQALSFLHELAAELSEIRRAKEYGFWRSDTTPRAQARLAALEPFCHFTTCRIDSGDGARAEVSTRLGEWAIDRLVAKQTPEQILAAFHAEVARNVGAYEEVSPILGAQFDAGRELAGGLRLVPHSQGIFDREVYTYRFQWPQERAQTGFLVQPYSVTPAFTSTDDSGCGGVTAPDQTARRESRERVRMACLLASSGGIEMPMSVILGDRQSLFQVEGNTAYRPAATLPLVPFQLDLDLVDEFYSSLATFTELAVVSRAIDRLGSSRTSADPVNRALDLGMAAEIVLMHDNGGSNAEITHKISSRAAWLLGTDPETRSGISRDMKELYATRSKAVHEGILPTRRAADLDAADRLVLSVLQALVRRGEFPDWNNLTLGG